MPRSSTNALYTRVDNSFSNPVFGTTISPTDADTFFDDVEASMNAFIGTSTTSLAIGTGSKTFTVASSPSTKVFLANTQIHAFSLADSANYMDCTVTSYNTTTGALVTDCFAIGGSGTITDWVIISAGARGAAGAAGSTGERAGFKYTFNSATSGDPGSGKFLVNNATFASATTLNISETDGDSVNLASLLATLDDGTSTNKCLVVWLNSDGSKGFIGYLTGTLTDNGSYDGFSFTPVTSWGSPANNDVFRMTVSRVGDKGADGAGTGDFSSNTASSVDGEMVLFSGTGGKTGKRSTLTGGLLKSTSGVPAIAAEGTDYWKPGATDVAVADGGTGASTATAALSNLSARGQGKETIFIPAAAMISRTTNGAAAGSVELSTNKVMVKSLDFDTTTQEFAQFSVWFPKSWNLGTVTFQPSFSQLTTAAGGVVFGLAGVAVSSTDDLDAALGTAQTSTTTAGTLNKEYQGPESAAITIAGTPAAGDRVIFQINRTVADASDTLAQDARLHGVRLFFTTNAVTDA